MTSPTILSERLTLSIRFNEIEARLKYLGCQDSIRVAQISLILPALTYKSIFLGNDYMSSEMILCSFEEDAETVFLSCEPKDELIQRLAHSGFQVYNLLKCTVAWNNLVSDTIGFEDQIDRIYKILTK